MEETTTTPVTTRSVGIRYGVIMGIVSIAYFVILNIAGIDMTQGPGRWSSLIFNVAIIFLAHKYFKDNGDGYMSIGQGSGISFWLALVSSVLSSIFTYIYIKFIDHAFIQQMLDKTREGMEEKGMAEDQIEQAMTMTAKFMTPEIMFGFGLFFGIIILFIIGVVVSLVTQKKSPEAFV